MKRDWMIKLDSGEYLREWRGFSPYWIGCFYGDSIMLGGEDEFSHCYDFFSGIGDVEWWIAAEIEKLTEEQKDRMYSLMVRNREVGDWIDSRRSSIREMCDIMGIGTEYVYRLGNKLIKQVLESHSPIEEYKKLLTDKKIMQRVTLGQSGKDQLEKAGVIKKWSGSEDYMKAVEEVFDWLSKNGFLTDDKELLKEEYLQEKGNKQLTVDDIITYYAQKRN
jgi:hypothetical protein